MTYKIQTTSNKSYSQKNRSLFLFLLFFILLAQFSIQAFASPLELRIKIKPNPAGEMHYSLFSPELDINTETRPFNNPLSNQELNELRWYLEEYYKWPVGPDIDRGKRIEKNIGDMGSRLFQAVFSDADGRAIWQQFRDQDNEARVLTIDSQDSEILKLPWELLAERKKHAFALDISIRRRVHESKQRSSNKKFKLPVRILMVVARPNDSSFIDPRASSKALLDAVDNLGPENVQVEFLQPPTFAALSQRLRDKKAPPVHVVHFDGHGSFNTRTQLGQLAFENTQGTLDAVDPQRLGTLMTNSKTPLLLLDACQSAQADGDDPFNSVAPRLIESGVGSVVAMPYSVLVKTSSQFFREFYRTLAQGDSIAQAVDKGRWSLLDKPERFEIYHPDQGEIQVRLKDWFLPVLYQRKQDPAPFAGMKAPSHAIAEETPKLLGDFPKPRYQFIGRSVELWQLQRSLRQRNIVILHGLGGQGKTALATEAAKWLTRTGQFQRAVFVSFEQGGDVDYALALMGDALLGKDFAALSREKRLPALHKALKESATLLVWDNFESVLPKWEAALEQKELNALLELGLQLSRSANTRLLITSRDPEIPHPDYQPSNQAVRISLGGMRPDEALKLAGSVLKDKNLPRPEREPLQKVLKYLDGHILSILLVVPQLGENFDNQQADKLIQRFSEYYQQYQDKDLDQKRNRSLMASLDFSLKRISPEQRKQLIKLGVFRQGVWSAWLRVVTEMDGKTWEQVKNQLIPELEQAGLLKIIPIPFSKGALKYIAGQEPTKEDYDEKISINYYRFHPTLSPYLRDLQSPEQREKLEKRYRQVYHVLAKRLYHLDDRSPHVTRALVQREFPNLRRALDLTLEAKDLDAVDFANSLEIFLNVFGRWRERDSLLAAVGKLMPEQAQGPVTKNEVLLSSRQGEQLLQQGRAEQAESLFRQLLQRMEVGMAYQGGYDRAMTLTRLGRSLEAQGKTKAAAQTYRKTLLVLESLEQQNRSVLRLAGLVHTDLADVLTNTGAYGEAREEYIKGLVTAKEQKDSRQTAAINGQLGTLAMLEKNYSEARKRHQVALQIFQQMKEPRSEAIAYHQLARVAETQAKNAKGEQRLTLLAEADERYRQSSKLSEKLGNNAGAANSANQLAIVAIYAGRYADALRWFQKAIDYFEKSGSTKELAVEYNNLANLLFTIWEMPSKQRPSVFAEQDLLKEAEIWMLKALEIDKAIGDVSVEIWTSYGILAKIATAKGNKTQAQQWRHKERIAYSAFPGHWYHLQPIFAPVIKLIQSALEGDKEAQKTVEEILLKFDERSMKNLVAALRDVLNGERDIDKLTEIHHLDREDYLILSKTNEKAMEN